MEFEELRGFDGIKEANININGRNVRIAVANGLGNTRRLLEGLRNGEEQFDAIEVMACPGGCIGGGGQPYHRGDISVLKRRAEGIYSVDKAKLLRRSHENPKIKQLYDEYLGEVAGPMAHELLHTTYKAKPKL